MPEIVGYRGRETMANKSSQGAWGVQAPIYWQNPPGRCRGPTGKGTAENSYPPKRGFLPFQDGLCQGPLRPLLLEVPQRPRRQQIILLEKIDVSLDLDGGGDERESDQEAAISTSSLASRAL